MKSAIKKMSSLLLTLCLVVSAFVFVQPTEVYAYTVPGSISKETVNSNIDYLLNTLTSETTFFTVNQQSCRESWEGGHACENCMNSDVVKAAWFKNIFGDVSAYQFPISFMDGVLGYQRGYSCYGFANFAQWYIFKTAATDEVDGISVVENVTWNAENLHKYAKPGDVIRSNGHSMIVVSVDGDNITILDCNGWAGDGLNCRVHCRTLSCSNGYYSGYPMYISTAANSPYHDPNADPDEPDTPDQPKIDFTDVSDAAFYYNAVNWAVENGVTKGTSDTTFSPDQNCTRGQIVTFLWRAAGSPESRNSYNPFVDVSSGSPYYKAILWAVENGITTGISPTVFGVDEFCTRAQAMTFLYRFMDNPQYANGSAFYDVTARMFCYNAVSWAVENGITNGTNREGTLFSPDQYCTRGQIVTFLYRTVV